jgi:glycerol 2-dehydrogenase (NADP+)
VTPTRIDENRKIVSLEAADLEALEDIHKKKGLTRFVYPEFGVSYIDLTESRVLTMSKVNLGFPDKQ